MSDIANIEYRTGDDSVINASLSLLPWQFNNKENIVKLMTVVAVMKQKIDDVVIDLAKYRLIDTAYGIQLDNVGYELGVYRQGSSDDEFRTVLKIRAFRRTSQGTRPDIVSLLARIVGTSQEDIDVYVGNNKTVDVSFIDSCGSLIGTTEELNKMFPVITNHRILAKASNITLGFTSVFNETDIHSGTGPFSSVFDTNTVDKGRLASLVSSSE